MTRKTFKTKTPAGISDTLPKADTIRARNSNLPGGKLGFMMWTRKYMPEVYTKIISTVRDESTDIAGMGDVDAITPAVPPAVAATSTAPASSSWAETIKNITLPLLGIYQQKKILDLQLDRAKAGLSPLDIANVEQYTASNAVRVGITSDTQRTLLIGAGVLVGGLLLFKVLGRARGH